MRKRKPEGKKRVTIRLDSDIITRFTEIGEKSGLGYQTLINAALREYLDGKVEKTLRRIIREELQS